MIILLLVGNELLLAGLAVVSVVGLLELTKATGVHEADKKINALEIAGIISTICWYVAIEIAANSIDTTLAYGFGIMVLTVMADMVIYVITFPRFDSKQTLASIFSFIYCPVMLSFVYMIRSLDYGIYLIWMVFVCSWACDIFAYLVGVKIGKHKFVPKLSPKKSVEGAVGGVLGSAVVGALYAAFALAPQISSRSAGSVIAVIVVISMLGALISMFGDLAASAIKRNNDIKDYGKLIPGHGGIMDRFDSVIFVAPIVYVLSLLFINYIG